MNQNHDCCESIAKMYVTGSAGIVRAWRCRVCLVVRHVFLCQCVNSGGSRRSLKNAPPSTCFTNGAPARPLSDPAIIHCFH
jgi:hypothetical protein